MGNDLLISEGSAVDNDGNSNTIAFKGDVSIGGVTFQGTPITGNSPRILDVDAAIHTFHDVVFRPTVSDQTNGTVLGMTTTDVGTPRVSLADGATQRIKWVQHVPLGWHTVGINFAWCKETAGSGNVKWQLAYQVMNLFTFQDAVAGAVTTLNLGAVAVPATEGTLAYLITGQNIDSAPGAFGITPLIMASLSRLGADAADTYAGAVSVFMTSLSRA